jgi:hypothetical protein
VRPDCREQYALPPVQRVRPDCREQYQGKSSGGCAVPMPAGIAIVWPSVLMGC